MTNSRRADLLALAILTSLIALLFVDVLTSVNAIASRDLLQYAHPSKKILHDVVAGGEFPYWNRRILGGQPLAANPAHEVFYPLTWLILLPSFEYGFQLSIVLHLWIAAITMYALLRSLKMAPPAACFGALSFALGGVVLSYLTLLPILFSAAWLPAVLLFGRRFLRDRAWRDLALASFFLALQVLVGEPTTILQTVLLLGIHASVRHRAAGIARALLICLFAACLGAVQALPAVDHGMDSVRARGLPFETMTEWSMPLARVSELLYPNVFGHSMLNGRRLYWAADLYPGRRLPFLFSIYPGLLVTVLALGGLAARIRGSGPALAVLGISVIVALGANTPLWRALFDAGLLRTLRFPEKFVLAGVFALTVLAARVLDRMLAGDERLRAIVVHTALAVTIVTAIFALVAVSPWHASIFRAMWNPSPRLFLEMLAASRSAWILAAGRALLLLILLRGLTRARPVVWMSIASVFLLLDLVTQVPELTPRVPPDFLRTEPPLLARLPRNRTEFRFFHLANYAKTRPEVAPMFRAHPDLPWVERNAALPMIPAAHGVETAIDVDYDLTALQSTTEFTDAVWRLSKKRHDWVDVAAGFSNVWFYSVLNRPSVAWTAARGDRRRLQPMDLREVSHQPRYSFAGALEPIRDGNDFVQKLASGSFDRRTAFVRGTPFTPAPGRVLQVRESANAARIDVDTAGRAFLVMSVTPHKYWQVTVDGRPTESVVTNVGYQGVAVPSPGRHVVEMRYRNPLVPAGGAVSLTTLLILAALCARGSRGMKGGTTMPASDEIAAR